METPLERLVAEALKLTPHDRATFASVLLASLEESDANDDAWELEVECRIAEVENGATPVISMAAALAQVRASLK